MPTDSDKKDFKIGIIGEGGKFHEIGSQIENLEINSPPEGRFDKNTGQFEVTFDSLFAKLTPADLVLHQFYGYPLEKLLQNNWRRLHGLPMKRRKRR